MLARSPIVVEGAEEGGAAPGQAGGGFDEYGGIDPAMDPEMAMVRLLPGPRWRVALRRHADGCAHAAGNAHVPHGGARAARAAG